jgi:hypothetical protein
MVAGFFLNIKVYSNTIINNRLENVADYLELTKKTQTLRLDRNLKENRILKKE